MSSRPPLPLLCDDDEEPLLPRDDGREFFEPPQAERTSAIRPMRMSLVASTHRR
jgi:hypothetical protein